MYYKQHHSVAVRQRFFQKRQVGSAQLPRSMPKDQGIGLAKGVMHRPCIVPTLALSVTDHAYSRWQCHTAFWLGAIYRMT
eukprot:3171185-Amphidinium_carterae.1